MYTKKFICVCGVSHISFITPQKTFFYFILSNLGFGQNGLSDKSSS